MKIDKIEGLRFCNLFMDYKLFEWLRLFFMPDLLL